MSDLKVHIGDSASLTAMGDRFIAAWNRAVGGHPVNERHLSFGTLQEAAAVLTPRRMELLRAIHDEPAASISPPKSCLPRHPGESRDPASRRG